MKKEKGILTGLIAACVACVISAASCSLSTQTSNKPTQEIPLATVSVSYTVDVVGFYTTHLGFASEVPTGAMTSGRARALVGAVVGLISVLIGGLALARSTGRLGNGSGRAGAIVALVLGLIGLVLSVVHLGSSTGGFGTGGGRAGAIVALVLGLIGMNLGGLALARSRRSRSTS